MSTAVEELLKDRTFENFVGGEYSTIGSDTYEVVSPFDEDYSVEIRDSNLADTPRTISASRKAVEEVDALSYSDRKQILKDAAEDFTFTDEEVDYFTKMLGMPRKSVEWKLEQGRDILEYLPDVLDAKYSEYEGEIAEKNGPGMYEVHKRRDQPLSVFLPANDPSVAPYILAHTVMTGNTLIARPSSEEIYSTLKTAELLTEHGYPDGALNVILYDSADEQNEAHRQSMLNETGATIVFGGDDTVEDFRNAAGDAQKALIGFGEGRANAYVFADADLDEAVDSIVDGMTRWPNGCNATKAVRVDPTVYDEFKDLLVERLNDLDTGDLMNEETDIGYIDSEVVSHLESRVSSRAVASADELLYPEVEDIGLNGDRLEAGVAADGGNAMHMTPIVVEAASEESEFMHQEYPGYVLGITAVAPEDMPDHFRQAYMNKGNTPITFSYYTESLDEEKRELEDQLPAHYNLQNKATVRINPWLRHQGIDLVDEMTRTESKEVEPGFWEGLLAKLLG